MRDCHVRHLTVQAADAAAARRSAVLVEDGLRTASLPGESSRLLIVRKLDIGAIPAGVNSTAVAQRIELALAQAPLQAISALHPIAASAAAVYFADEVEACVQLAVRGARGQAPAAWFWPRAVSGWRNGWSAPDAVRCALAAAARLDSGPAAVVRVIGGLQTEAVLDRALAALVPQDGAALLQLCGWRLPPPDATAAPDDGTQRALDAQAAHDARLAAWAERWGADDARTLWLATVLLAVAQPAWASDPLLAVLGAAWLQQLRHPGSRGLGAPVRPAAARARLGAAFDQQNEAGESAAGAQLANAQPPRPAAAVRRRADESSPMSTGLPPVAAAAGFSATEAEAESPAEDEARAIVWWRGLPLRPTGSAGIWFMLPVLRRLGIQPWLEAHPSLAAAGIMPCVLAELARRLATLSDDPIWPELAPGRAGAEGGEELEQAVAWWCEQVEAWCAGPADLSLPDIVRRAGWLYTTRTHVDVFFDLSQADVRIRRLGLDLDPGWVPWLGRVVTFYYETGLAAGRTA